MGIKLILLLILSFKAYGYELGISSLTMHTTFSSNRLHNRIDKNGVLIYNPIISYSPKSSNYTFITGLDSMGGPIVGGFYKMPLNENCGLLGGFYLYDISYWRKYDMHIEFRIGPVIPNVGVYYRKQIDHNVYYEPSFNVTAILPLRFIWTFD